jgi:type I restriction enzyme R subunit
MTNLPQTRIPSSNFAFLAAHDGQLVRYGEEAERYVTNSANTCLLKLRQFAELLAQLIAAKTGCYQEWNEPFAPLLDRLCDGGVLPPRETLIFHSLRKTGNSANHSHKAIPCF